MLYRIENIFTMCLLFLIPAGGLFLSFVVAAVMLAALGFSFVGWVLSVVIMGCALVGAFDACKRIIKTGDI